MADTYRRHALIDAPVEDVWSVVSDPHTHPDWWPELVGVDVPDDVAESGKFVRHARRFGFLDVVDGIWVMEPMEQMKEVNFRCTLTGSYMRFSLTPAQDNTFVQVDGGVIPNGVQGRIMKVAGPLFFTRWIAAMLDKLPDAVARTKRPA